MKDVKDSLAVNQNSVFSITVILRAVNLVYNRRAGLGVGHKSIKVCLPFNSWVKF